MPPRFTHRKQKKATMQATTVKEEEPATARDDATSEDAELEKASVRLDALLHEQEGLQAWLDLLKAEFYARDWTAKADAFTDFEHDGYVHGIHATEESLRSLAIDVEYVMFFAS